MTNMAKKKRSRAGKPVGPSRIAEVLVKRAEADESVKEDLLERVAEIVERSPEFKDELVKSVLASKKLREDALKVVVEQILD